VESFGQKMKKEREKQGITLDEIAVATKIGTRNLRAIEENEFNKLPGGIFNKGFVRAYARHLGMDEDRVVGDYLEASGEAKAAEEAQAQEVFPINVVEKEDEKRKAAASWNVPWGVLAVALVVVALGFAVWGLYFGERQEAVVSAPPQVQAQSAPTAPPVEAQPQAQTVPNAAPPPAMDGSANNAPVTPASGAATGATQGPPARTAERPALQSASLGPGPVSAPTPATETAPADATGTFDVAIRARQDSWLNITADGRVVMDGMLSADHDTLIRAREKITVRAGNISGVDVFFNGRPLTMQGEDGHAKVLTFGRSGLVSQ
jgi:cytoskeleton protein RodZ